jgi:hypothetical protein
MHNPTSMKMEEYAKRAHTCQWELALSLPLQRADFGLPDYARSGRDEQRKDCHQ